MKSSAIFPCLFAFLLPRGVYGRYPLPDVWSLYNYWHERKISTDGKLAAHFFKGVRRARTGGAPPTLSIAFGLITLLSARRMLGQSQGPERNP